MAHLNLAAFARAAATDAIGVSIVSILGSAVFARRYCVSFKFVILAFLSAFTYLNAILVLSLCRLKWNGFFPPRSFRRLNAQEPAFSHRRYVLPSIRPKMAIGILAIFQRFCREFI